MSGVQKETYPTSDRIVPRILPYVFSAEEIYGIEHALFDEVSVWDAETDDERVRMMCFCDGVKAMTQAIIDRMRKAGKQE